MTTPKLPAVCPTCCASLIADGLARPTRKRCASCAGKPTKSVTVAVRMTDAEAARLDEHAQAFGVRGRGAAVRLFIARAISKVRR